MGKQKKSKGSLFERISGVNTLGDNASILKNSKFFVDEFYDTGIPAINLALSAKINGGFSRGSTLIAGDSKTFKTLFMLEMASSYLKALDDAIFVYYDVEFGSNSSTMESVGIDTSRVYHKPVTTVEALKIDLANLLNEIDENDNVIIGIDSLGAIASEKEIEDAENGKNVADMTRAKMMKSFWRVINPKLNIKKVPLIAIGQTYQTQEMFSKDVVSGGKGMIYFPNNIWMVGKQQIKNQTTKERLGSIFKIKVVKGRLVKEDSIFPIEVTFEDGINRFSALLDIALSLGYVRAEKKGWFTHDGVDKNYRRADTNNINFWKPLLTNKSFLEDVEALYALGSLKQVDTVDISDMIEEVYVDVDEDNNEIEKPKVKEYKMKKSKE